MEDIDKDYPIGLRKKILDNFIDYNNVPAKITKKLFSAESRELLKQLSNKKTRFGELPKVPPINATNNNSLETFRQFIYAIRSQLIFNRRNFINIHPSPPLISGIATLHTYMLNPNNIVREVSSPTTQMEEDCVRFVANMLGMQAKTCGGNIVSGGTVANITALMYARNKTYDLNSENVMNTGVPDEKKILLTTANAHYSIEKAWKILGMGGDNVVKIPVKPENNFLPTIDEYKQYIEHYKNKLAVVVVTAGTTETGIIEPIKELALLKEKYRFVLHIDAAYGGFMASAPAIKAKFAGINLADTVTIDAHKLGYVGYPCGMILFNDAQDMSYTVSKPAKKLRRGEVDKSEATYIELELGCGATTIEGSRPGHGTAALWCALKLFGKEGYAAMHSKIIAVSKYLAKKLSTINNIQVINKPDLNLVTFRYFDTKLTEKKLIEKNLALYNYINKHGFVINKTDNIAGTGIFALRTIIMHPLVSNKDIDDFIMVVEQGLSKLSKK